MSDALDRAVAARLDAIERERIVDRIWGRDHTVWKADPNEILDRLGWLDVGEAMRGRIDELEAFARRAADDGLETAVLLGMGGSSLAPEVFARTFGAADGALELIVLDTTHPATIARLLDELDLRTTLILVASKSGTTTETRSHLASFWDHMPNGDRFVAITDPGTPLEALGQERGFRWIFRNPKDIGGRYSALSYFGLVPAALIGAPLHEVLDASDEMGRAGRRPVTENPAAVLGATMGEAAQAGRDKLTMVLREGIASLGAWVEQLIAESTGKEGTGIVPVVDEPLGAAEVYGEDRLFVAVGDLGGLDALERAGQPVVRLDDVAPDGLGGLGAEFFRWELATAMAGYVLGINPFDQPNVEEAKAAAREILAGAPVQRAGFDDLGPLLQEVRPGDYVAIQAYLDRTPEAEDALERARLTIRDRHGVATTTGFGPRFLHSTGQLHKGGPDTGVFVQVVDVVDATREVDVPIPGQPFTFGTLIDAQALGDLRALRTRGRRVARVTLDRLTEVT